MVFADAPDAVRVWTRFQARLAAIGRTKLKGYSRNLTRGSVTETPRQTQSGKTDNRSKPTKD